MVGLHRFDQVGLVTTALIRQTRTVMASIRPACALCPLAKPGQERKAANCPVGSALQAHCQNRASGGSLPVVGRLHNQYGHRPAVIRRMRSTSGR
jgi:hypothetical protein